MRYNIKDFGAVGDGKTNDTKAIQLAIDACDKTGGRVFIPAGIFITGTLFLGSDIDFHLAHRAKIKGSQNINDYPSNYTGCIEAPSFNQTLFIAENQRNITFSGHGVIDGQGASFTGDRPMLMRFVNCTNVTISGITLKDSGSWCCHMIGCKSIIIKDMELYNHSNRNNDGFDLDSCKDVFISNVKIDSIDDSICLKSTTDVPCQNITITNCILSSETATIKLGTSSKVGFKDIAISNCIMHDCPMGTIKLLMVDGGLLENININNIVMNRVGSPLFIRLGKRNLKFDKPAEMDFWGEGQKPNSEPGKIKNIMISNITANVTVTQRDKTPIMITGLTDRLLENITLSNFSIHFPGGGTKDEANGIIPEDPYKYPEQWFFGVLPAYGIFIRHVENLTMDMIKIYVNSEDKRDAFVYENLINPSITQSNI